MSIQEVKNFFSPAARCINKLCTNLLITISRKVHFNGVFIRPKGGIFWGCFFFRPKGEKIFQFKKGYLIRKVKKHWRGSTQYSMTNIIQCSTRSATTRSEDIRTLCTRVPSFDVVLLFQSSAEWIKCSVVAFQASLKKTAMRKFTYLRRQTEFFGKIF